MVRDLLIKGYTNKKINNSKSTMQTTKKIVDSIWPPVFIFPSELAFNGQNGFIPSIVKLSAKRCEEYPRKKGRARIG